MISKARAVIEHIDDHPEMTRKQREEMVDAVPAWQWQVTGGWWPDLAMYCRNRIEPNLLGRPVNGLNIEIGAPAARCLYRSPDGRGLLWLMSGGSALAYGICEQSACERCADGRPRGAGGGVT